MHLAEYLEMRDLTDRRFAEQLNDWLTANHTQADHVSTSAVQRYRTGKRLPRGERMQAIFAVTDGEVDANAMMNLEGTI